MSICFFNQKTAYEMRISYWSSDVCSSDLGLASLGAWQLGRMHQKQALLDAVEQVLDQRMPQPLALAADAARARDYDWASGIGRFVDGPVVLLDNQQRDERSEEHTSELQSLMRISYAVFCLKKKKNTPTLHHHLTN